MNYRTSSKRWSHTTGMCFLSMDSTSISGDFHSRLTQVNNHPPIFCKPPRCGTHEYEVMRNLLERMDEDGVAEEEYIPWGELVVLAAKPHQENMACHEYQWRLCVSYQKLNQFTRPFAFPITRCDDAVQDIDTEENYFIAVDMNSGYWQVVA